MNMWSVKQFLETTANSGLSLQNWQKEKTWLPGGFASQKM